MEINVTAQMRVLSDEELLEVHERSLKLLATTGVRVLSETGRKVLKDAGADGSPNSDIIFFPRNLVEEAIRLSPRNFILGSRCPGWNLELNTGKCTLVADGAAVSVLDGETGEMRPGTLADWQTATCLIDAMDEIGVYWNMIRDGTETNTGGDFVAYWHRLLANCSKHIQDSTDNVSSSQLLLEILQIAFGSREVIRSTHPYSHLLCPISPLVIDQ